MRLIRRLLVCAAVAAVGVMLLPAMGLALNVPYWLWLILCIIESVGGNPLYVL